MSWELWLALVVGVSLVGWVIARLAIIYFFLGGNSRVDPYRD